MKVYSIVNLKGGVGKTVTAVNLAALLADVHQKQVLLIDADAQANATRFFGCPAPEITLGDVLDGKATEPLAVSTGIENLALLPADISLLEYDIASVRAGGNGVEYLREYLAQADASGIDTVIIDCPPAFSAASVAAIANSTEVIIPVKIDGFSLAGLDEVARQVYGLRKIRPDIRIAGVLVTMFHNAEVQRQGLELLRCGAVPVFETVIRRTDKVDESTFSGQPLYRWSQRCSAGQDYMHLCRELLSREDAEHE